MESQSINAANTIMFDYDNDELLTKAGDFNLTRHTQHGLVETTSINTIEQTLHYTGFAELENDKTIVNDGTTTNLLYETSYIRDKLGRITDKTETIAGVVTNYHYDYDLAGRLEHVFTNGVLTDSYNYDVNGNRLTTTQNGVSVSATYDDQDRLINYGQFTYRYSDNGELQHKTNTSTTKVSQYNYDVLGNLRKVELPNATTPDTVIEYVIDGQNRRIGKKIDGVLVQGFLYQDQLNPVAELNADGSIKTQFIYADKTNVPAYMIQGGINYRIISDHLGSPRLVVNTQTGAVIQSMDYDVWGNVILDSNPGFQPFAFAGGIYDQHSKLTRFGARDYDAQIGRWTSKDPIRFNGGDANLFGYIENDPINLIDPSGLCADYWDRYKDHLNEYLINVGPYAAMLGGGLWPKSLSPATSGRPPLLGSTNPITSVPRAVGFPGAGSTLIRTGAAGIGLATVGIGYYNIGVFVSGMGYAAFPGSNGLPSNSSDCSCQGQ